MSSTYQMADYQPKCNKYTRRCESPNEFERLSLHPQHQNVLDGRYQTAKRFANVTSDLRDRRPITKKPKRESSAPSAPSRQLSNGPTSSRAEAGSQQRIRNTERCKSKASRKKAPNGNAENILKRHKQRTKAEKKSVVILKRKQPSQWRNVQDEPESSVQEERPRKKSRDDKDHPEHSNSSKKNKRRTKSRDDENSFEQVFGEKIKVSARKIPKKAKKALAESSNNFETQRTFSSEETQRTDEPEQLIRETEETPMLASTNDDEECQKEVEPPMREALEPMPQIDFGGFSDDPEDTANEVICIGEVSKPPANNEEAIYISDSEEDNVKEDDREVEVWEQEDYFDQF